MTPATMMILKTRLSNEALTELITMGRIAKRADCCESNRCFGALTLRVKLNLMRAGVAEHLDTGSVRLTDAGLELAVAMKDEPFERYARKSPRTT